MHERARFDSDSGDTVTHRPSNLSVVLLVASALPVLASCQPAGEGINGEAAVDTAAIMSAADSLRMAYEDAYNAGDTAAVADLISGDFVFLPAQGSPIRGRQKVMSFLNPGIRMSQEVSITSSAAKVLGKDAVVDHGTATFTVMAADADTGQTTHRHGYLIVTQRTADGWKFIRAANTRLQSDTGPKGSGGEQ